MADPDITAAIHGKDLAATHGLDVARLSLDNATPAA
jgi:hypothetical protein